MIFIVDRIENGFAVCEDGKKKMHNIPLTELPEGTAAGSVIVFVDGKYILDDEERERRRRKIKELWSEIEGVQ